MAITERQRQERGRRIGSSDATRIMAGDWQRLWREKTGRAAPPDLDMVAAVQIGIATEPLHARFWQHHTGIPILPGSDRTRVHPRHDWMICHPDFLTWRQPPSDPFLPPDTVLEAKFTGTQASDAELAERYFWQVQHQLMVLGLAQGILSILRPGGWSWVEIPAMPRRQALLFRTLAAFWWHVENDCPPEDPFPIAPPDLDRLPVLDMGRHNAFAAQAATLLRTRGGMQEFRDAEKALKALMPEQARLAFIDRAGGVDGAADGALYLARSRDGRLSLHFGPPPRQHAARARPWALAGAADTPEEPPPEGRTAEG